MDPILSKRNILSVVKEATKRNIVAAEYHMPRIPFIKSVLLFPLLYCKL